MTSLSFGPRSGSGQMKTGRRTQSESWPRAWLVLEPSKPQMPGSSPSATIWSCSAGAGDGSVPSIQMYSAWYGTCAPLLLGCSATSSSVARSGADRPHGAGRSRTCHRVAAMRRRRFPRSVNAAMNSRHDHGVPARSDWHAAPRLSARRIAGPAAAGRLDVMPRSGWPPARSTRWSATWTATSTGILDALATAERGGADLAVFPSWP